MKDEEWIRISEEGVSSEEVISWSFFTFKSEKLRNRIQIDSIMYENILKMKNE